MAKMLHTKASHNQFSGSGCFGSRGALSFDICYSRKYHFGGLKRNRLVFISKDNERVKVSGS